MLYGSIANSRMAKGWLQQICLAPILHIFFHSLNACVCCSGKRNICDEQPCTHLSVFLWCDVLCVLIKCVRCEWVDMDMNFFCWGWSMILCFEETFCYVFINLVVLKFKWMKFKMSHNKKAIIISWD